jgi:hypothetical protein
MRLAQAVTQIMQTAQLGGMATVRHICPVCVSNAEPRPEHASSSLSTPLRFTFAASMWLTLLACARHSGVKLLRNLIPSQTRKSVCFVSFYEGPFNSIYGARLSRMKFLGPARFLFNLFRECHRCQPR